MSEQSRDWNVLSMLEWGTGYFKSRGVPDPRHSIEWLLAQVLDTKRLDLYLQYDRPLSENELAELRPLVKRRASHEPLQYITGFTDFMNVRISVSPEVLIPRIETEQLVEILLDREPEGSSLRILDIGTGSGCIAIALKKERPEWDLHAMDLSPEALELARRNAGENETDITFLKGDIFKWEKAELEPPYDLIVSNPPYVLPDEKSTLEQQVISHEPEIALFCENLGEMYGAIRDCASRQLAENGRLYLEIHENHPQVVRELFEGEEWEAELLKDYEKKYRFLCARLNS